ncbi:hypothetical protein BU16DRAFT_63427 [Lophium mytilinum]|uniref:Glycosyltransferase family 25 protein n=1 Tax=Lophium mytilinum TaxID=390894 RepID=A0A6A6QPH7_9PEZI|nr:hypothetical protein BU16DRAFT_63427 [Lophium mytilinum]
MMAWRLAQRLFQLSGVRIMSTMHSKGVPEVRLTAKHIRYGSFALFIVFVCSLGLWSDSILFPLHKLAPIAASLELPANSTLGFGALLAVSPATSPRRHGLIQAANVTDMQITFPELPIWTDEDEQNFRAPTGVGESSLTKGMVFAWLSHLHVLRWFLESGLETALIMEDDMDWDIHLRTLQVPRVAASIRSLFNQTKDPSLYYYGDLNRWDMIYLGHFDRWSWLGTDIGVGVLVPSNLTDHPHRFIPDDTMPPRYDMHPEMASVLTALDVPPNTRILHPSKFPFGSWAYAVTRESAARILSDDVASAAAPKWASMDSLDNALSRACGGGALRCYTVNPEIFHHLEGPKNSLIDYNYDRTEKSKAVINQRLRTGETDHIRCGFASGHFEYGNDTKFLKYLRTEVGRKGRCLKPGREAPK